MKKFNIILILFISFVGVSVCHAETFREAEYVSGVYIKKIESDDKKYFLTSQFIRRNSDNLPVYCIEPFKELSTTSNYSSYINDLNMSGLTKAVWDRVVAASYFGYGYESHNDPIWYSVTQLYIWRLISPGTPIYFTDTLNGNEIHTYDSLINELDNLVFDYFLLPRSLKNDIVMNYGDTYEFEIPSGYNVSNNIFTRNDNKLIIQPYYVGDRSIKFYKGEDDVVLYVNGDNQKLIKANNAPYIEKDLKVVSSGGSLSIIFNKQNEYGGSCVGGNNIYGLYDSNYNLITRIDIDEKNIYNTNLGNGTYYVKQISNSCGYMKDDNYYKYVINNNTVNDSIDVVEKTKNIYIKHNICIKDNCSPGVGTIFNISGDNKDFSITTGDDGIASGIIGYGNYVIDQKEGNLEYYQHHDVLVNTSYDDNDIYLSFNSYILNASLKVLIKDDNDNYINNTKLCLNNDINSVGTCYKVDDGIISFDKLKVGTYYIKIDDVPSNYITNDNIISVDLDGDVVLPIIYPLRKENVLKRNMVINNNIEDDIVLSEDIEEVVDSVIEQEVKYVTNPDTNDNIMYYIALCILIFNLVIILL